MSYKGLRFDNSKYFKKWEEKNAAVAKNKDFQKELKHLFETSPIFETRNAYLDFIQSQSLSEDDPVAIFYKGKRKKKRCWLCNPHEWEEFSKKWEIDMVALLCFNEKETERPASIIIRHDLKGDSVSLKVNNHLLTEADIKDIAPLLIDTKEKIFGKSPNTKGRKKDASTSGRNAEIKKEVRQRIRNGEKIQHACKAVARKNKLSPLYTRKIYYS